jgi:pullulanase
VPQATYTVVCRDGVIREQGLATLTGSAVSVNAQTALILHD